jgi:hypothetical protein
LLEDLIIIKDFAHHHGKVVWVLLTLSVKTLKPADSGTGLHQSSVLTGRNSTFRTIQSIRCTYFGCLHRVILQAPSASYSKADFGSAHPVPVKVFKDQSGSVGTNLSACAS